MEQASFVYTTFPDEATGAAIGRTLVDRELAACVNLLPGTRAIYRWQGEIAEGGEVAALIKTRRSLCEAVRSAIEDLHPYDTPVVLFLPLDGGDPRTLAWITASTAG